MAERVEFAFEPLPKQREFIESTARFRLYVGGMGSAKTTAGVMEAILNSTRYAGNLGLVGRATYPELRDSTRRELLEFPVKIGDKQIPLLESPLIKKDGFNKAENTLTFYNGSQIIFRSLEDSFDKIKSLNLGWFWIDEATENSEDIWLGLVGRLRRKGFPHTGIATTNPEGHDWVWKTWVAEPRKDYAWFQASSHENIYLPPGYIASMERNFPKEWVDRYVRGSFDDFSGLIYKDFRDSEPWVVEPRKLPDSWYRFVAIDHGYRNPTGILWMAVDTEGNVFVYDEFKESGLVVSELAEIIKTKSKGQEIRQFVIDPATKQNKGHNAGKTIFSEFEEEEIWCIPAFNQVGAGVNRVQEYLRPEGGPKLKIFRNCVGLRSELQTYKWKDLRPGARTDEPEKPLKKNDHLVDALRYGVSYLYDTPAIRPKKKDWRDYFAIEKRSVVPSWMGD